MKGTFKEKKARYRLTRDGGFVIENYNFSKPLASFFPGIAGKHGIPMWIFYVNRGQAIASFGTKDKDHAIVEFFPANKSWQLTSLLGFRTFIKAGSGKTMSFYEPFHNGFANLGYDLTNSMTITAYDLHLEECNATLGLDITVDYFMIPNDTYAGLARIVTVHNRGAKKQRLQMCDGLPQIVPYGTSNLFLKKLGRTIEAWMNIKNLKRRVPYYKLDVDPTDRPEVYHIREGNFYLGFHHERNKSIIIKPVVDPQAIFGSVTDFSYPRAFLSSDTYRYPRAQATRNKVPCGFSLMDIELKPHTSKTLYSIVGFVRSQESLNRNLPRIARRDYLYGKQKENKEIIENLMQDIETHSASTRFNLYAKQTYLDNILRGGYPVVFKTERSNSTFYLYSRKHGDLERDYNKFQIQPTYYSQGNGNYRDVNQNRRSDIWFNPEIGDENIITFFNLLQTDGFNPLVVKGVSYSLTGHPDITASVRSCLKNPEGDTTKLSHFLAKPFSPGELILFLQENDITLSLPYDEFLARLLACANPIHEAEHGEGFWTDHWTYNLDLLESYLALYPEHLTPLIFESRSFTFFDNGETVKPRREKYIAKDSHVKQLHSLYADNAKKELIRKRTGQPHLVRTQYGHGDIYRTTLINKLACLAVNKLASLDAFGIGIEMEADKPNWYDALNGLPALFGSSLCETMELKRLIGFIKDALTKERIASIAMTEEVYDFLGGIHGLLKEYSASTQQAKDFIYWDKSCSLKEAYREKTRFGVSGTEVPIDTASLMQILDAAEDKLDTGIKRAYDDKRGVYYAYFINEVAQYTPLKTPYVMPTAFTQKKLPLFLESQMHALRVVRDRKQAKVIYAGTKKSPLYDRKLKMYKVTAPLGRMPEEIGRCRVFTPGWLENESIWLHMEYKYLLELLKSGLHEEFYADFKNALIPFQKPQRYGRSILENSSFLVSSAFFDKRLHGNGYVARLSGSTAEFLSMWLVMNVGIKPFLYENNALSLRLAPILASWLFCKNNTYGFRFLSTIAITYHNPKRKNTFGKDASRITRIAFNDTSGEPIEIHGDTIPSPFAGQIRAREIKQIDAYLE